jgi:hypothetical protein
MRRCNEPIGSRSGTHSASTSRTPKKRRKRRGARGYEYIASYSNSDASGRSKSVSIFVTCLQRRVRALLSFHLPADCAACGICTGAGARRCHICAAAARGCPCHIRIGTRLTSATSAPGLGSPLPHLHRDWAHPCHIRTGTDVFTGPHLSEVNGRQVDRPAWEKRDVRNLLIERRRP